MRRLAGRSCLITLTILTGAGAATAAMVPGSASQHAAHVAIAAAPGGHLWVLWYDTTNSKGVAQITVPKGTATGKHTATVTKADYTSATFTVTVS